MRGDVAFLVGAIVAEEKRAASARDEARVLLVPPLPGLRGVVLADGSVMLPDENGRNSSGSALPA